MGHLTYALGEGSSELSLVTKQEARYPVIHVSKANDCNFNSINTALLNAQLLCDNYAWPCDMLVTVLSVLSLYV